MGVLSAIKGVFTTGSKRSLENPQTNLSDPDDWLLDFFGAGDGSLPAVNRKTILSNPAIIAAIRRRAQTIASLGVGVYEKVDDGWERKRDHPLDKALNISPHPLYSPFQLWQSAITNLDATGNAFVVLNRNGRGDVVGLELVSSDKFIDIRKELTSGDYFYFFRGENNEVKSLPAEDVVHLKGLGYDAVTGLSPISLHHSAIAAGVANDNYSAAFFSSGGQLQYALEAPQEFSPKAKEAWRREWRRLFSGIKNAFKDIPIIDRGAKLHQLRLTAKDAAMVEAKKAFVQDAGRMFDVPAHMIGGGENQTFASVEVMVTDFVIYSIRNTAKQIESEMNRKAFSERDAGRLFVRFNIDSLLRGDTEARTKKIESELKWGIITKNEARKMLGYNKVKGGDVYLTPLNMEEKPQV